ncbi:MAG: nucleotidyltransferase domain-containing protein [Candidatus Brocadiia bacterium]
MEREQLQRELKRRLQEAFGDRLRGVILYGSEARGEPGQESDIDVMVLLQGPLNVWQDIKTGVEATYDLTLELGRPVHPDPVDAEEYRKGEFALYRNVKREGIVL